MYKQQAKFWMRGSQIPRMTLRLIKQNYRDVYVKLSEVLKKHGPKNIDVGLDEDLRPVAYMINL